MVVVYSYDFQGNNEQVNVEIAKCFVDIDDNNYCVNVLITNKNILIFHNANQNNVLNNRGMYIAPEYLLELKIPLENLAYDVVDGNTYLNFDKSDIVIYNLDLKRVVENKSKYNE